MAQTMVGAGPCFILVFTRNSHRTNLFGKGRYLNRNQELSTKGIVSCCIPSIKYEYVPAIKSTPEYPGALPVTVGVAFSAGSGFRLWLSGSENAEGQRAEIARQSI